MTKSDIGINLLNYHNKLVSVIIADINVETYYNNYNWEILIITHLESIKDVTLKVKCSEAHPLIFLQNRLIPKLMCFVLKRSSRY